jgi:hypothetical protein
VIAAVQITPAPGESGIFYVARPATDWRTILYAAAILGFRIEDRGAPVTVHVLPSIEPDDEGNPARPKGRATFAAACAEDTFVASGTKWTRNHVEDAMVGLFEPRLRAGDDTISLFQSNWQRRYRPLTRPSEADFTRQDPEPGDYTDAELHLAARLLAELVAKRCGIALPEDIPTTDIEGPWDSKAPWIKDERHYGRYRVLFDSSQRAERLWDEAWAQFLLRPRVLTRRSPSPYWENAIRRAFARGEIAAFRSPDVLGEQDARS